MRCCFSPWVALEGLGPGGLTLRTQHDTLARLVVAVLLRWSAGFQWTVARLDTALTPPGNAWNSPGNAWRPPAPSPRVIGTLNTSRGDIL